MAEILSKTLILALFLSIFYLNLSSAQLICWRCNPCPEPHDNTSSLVSAVTCTSTQTVCVKHTVRILNRDPQIAKGCVSSCTPSSANFFHQGAFVDCCNTNYCNLSPRNRFSLSISILFIIIFDFIFYCHQSI